ncbi:MAG TPA: choice-of-anchor L domain-containing protein, partial [Bacteroidales bacterium]|nr:choice-of-anchor L domain-containing protein [Bacteroidales bacterium]
TFFNRKNTNIMEFIKSFYSKLFILFGALLFSTLTLSSQITVQSPNGWTPLQLLENMLVQPPAISGVYIDNAKFCNSTAALPNSTTSRIGRFLNGSSFTDFPLTSGIIMTTGNISVAPGPNNNTSASSQNTQGIPDAQLAALVAPYSLGSNGASVLEFEFISISGTVSFEYVFASEEYPEYANTSFNDVFAFWVTGPDPVTGNNVSRNIALIPGTNLPVTINNLNHTEYTEYYYSVPSGSPGIQFDAFTYVPADSSETGERSGLVARGYVLPCTPYIMKLAIANVSDNILDSGVFLKEGSFQAPKIFRTHNYTIDNGDTLLKACNMDTLTFSLERRDPTRAYSYTVHTNHFPNVGVDLNEDYEIYYYHPVTGDYTQMTGTSASFRIPADSLSTYMVIKVADDAEFAPGEVKTLTLLLELETCDGIEDPRKDTLVYYIKDNFPIILSDTNIVGCELVNEITIEELGGGDVKNVTWIPSTNIDDPTSLSTTCNISDTITYTVFAWDDINCRKDSAIVNVYVVAPPTPSFTVSEKTGCAPLSSRITSTTTPADAEVIFVITSEDGTIQDTIRDQEFIYDFIIPGYYSIDYFTSTADAEACQKSLLNPNYIFVSDFPTADFTWTPDEPTNGRPIQFTNTSTGEEITDFHWNFGDGGVSINENPVHAYHVLSDENFNVYLKVTNRFGCGHDTLKQITVTDKYAFYVPNSFTPNNDGINDLFLPRVTDVLKYHLVVYDRYGKAIFQTINTEEAWDGTFNGAPCPRGVYTWVITYIRYSAQETELRKSGTVTLIR